MVSPHASQHHHGGMSRWARVTTPSKQLFQMMTPAVYGPESWLLRREFEIYEELGWEQDRRRGTDDES